ncbi:GNAT family N-acetyltransferase [Streptomyces sp. 8N616]|uniref:GNAT family N-acetyltransferase n=1 Tax=Streptomyces sp. 8N616 TaxID=3457414 RepID=UPI003FD1753F
MDITIRAARPEEFDALGEITAEAYLGDGLLDFGASDPYLEQLRDVRSRAEHTEVLVAADGASDELLGGVAFVAPGSPYANVAGPGEAEFRMLAVAPAARRRGAAEGLVRACLERARQLGLGRMVLSSQQRMLTAHRLYERLGFVRAPERDWEPIPGFPLWVFTAELGTAAE